LAHRNPSAKSPATIVDIAVAAGVSKSTVSLVLNGDKRVRAETRGRVEAAIARLGYIYNRSAATLRGATSSLVGLVINDLTNPFFAELAAGIEDALFKLGLVPILANTNESSERQGQVLRSLREHGVAGIIMSPARGTEAWTLVHHLPRSIPLVLTTRRISGSPLPYVGAANGSGAHQAVAHLVRLGHRRIGFLGGDANMTTHREREAGWREALMEAGISVDDKLVTPGAPTRRGGFEAMQGVLAMPRPPSAVLCYNDIVAIGATRALIGRGMTPGQDMAVIGFDDIAEAQDNAPPLTTISADTKHLGARCAQSLLGLIRGEDPAGLSYSGKTKLIIRESCGAAQLERKAS
jgi:LacI family transcriptional regulator